MKRILIILTLVAVPTVIAGCGGPKQEQVPAVEEVRPAPPPPATMPPETTMMRPESTPNQGAMPNQGMMPDTTGMQSH